MSTKSGSFPTPKTCACHDVLHRRCQRCIRLLIAGGLLFTAHGVTPEFLLNLLFYIIITPVISLTLTRIMYMSENKMVVEDALARIDSVLEQCRCRCGRFLSTRRMLLLYCRTCILATTEKPRSSRALRWRFSRGRPWTFVGPSGGGKSTLANLICRFFDVQSGTSGWAELMYGISPRKN